MLQTLLKHWMRDSDAMFRDAHPKDDTRRKSRCLSLQHTICGFVMDATSREPVGMSSATPEWSPVTYRLSLIASAMPVLFKVTM